MPRSILKGKTMSKTYNFSVYTLAIISICMLAYSVYTKDVIAIIPTASAT